MRKILFTAITALLFSSAVNSQTTTPSPADNNKAEFDKKFRFGLRITPQPTWFSTKEKNMTPAGAKFGFGFGLNMEFKLSDIVALQTGIGGDFEGGKYTFRNDKANKYVVSYTQDNTGAFIEPKQNGDGSELLKDGNITYTLKERTIKTTHVTIPVILKLGTKEYNGMKYFGMFGTEIGIRVKQLATDSYYESYKYSSTSTVVAVNTSPETQSNLVIGKDGSLIPLRMGLNVGAGMEYRLGGSTSAFFSINYFRSFTNQLRSEAKYLTYDSAYTLSSNTFNYSFVKQNLIQNAIRINIGILF